jgi:transposase InsO family protein
MSMQLRNVKTFDTLLEAQVMTARWRRHYDTVRPRSALGYVAAAPEATQPWLPSFASLSSPAAADTAGTPT